MPSRRHFITNSAITLAGFSVDPYSLLSSTKSCQFKISTCDWSIDKFSEIDAFKVAKEIGLDGIQVSLGSLDNNMWLRQKEVQANYIKESKKTGVKISSLAIGELNSFPYKSDPRTEEWVWDSVDVAKELDVSVILLAFFYAGDLRKDSIGKAEVVKRLKRVAPKAEKLGITLGIESYMTAEEHLDIMQQVGSPAIKVYYDFRNAADAGNDVFNELKLLGKDNICELHFKENGFLLGQGTLDWNRIGKALKEIGYQGDGWIQIEGAKPPQMDIVKACQYNLNYLHQIFG